MLWLFCILCSYFSFVFIRALLLVLFSKTFLKGFMTLTFWHIISWRLLRRIYVVIHSSVCRTTSWHLIWNLLVGSKDLVKINANGAPFLFANYEIILKFVLFLHRFAFCQLYFQENVDFLLNVFWACYFSFN